VLQAQIKAQKIALISFGVLIPLAFIGGAFVF